MVYLKETARADLRIPRRNAAPCVLLETEDENFNAAFVQRGYFVLIYFLISASALSAKQLRVSPLSSPR